MLETGNWFTTSDNVAEPTPGSHMQQKYFIFVIGCPKLQLLSFQTIFHITFLSSILAKCIRDEKYSGTSLPTSQNGFNIVDAAGSSVLRCTL